MKKLILPIVGLVATFSMAIAATDSLLQHAEQSAPKTSSAVLSPAEEPVSLSGSLIAAGLLAVGFLATRRRGE